MMLAFVRRRREEGEEAIGRQRRPAGARRARNVRQETHTRHTAHALNARLHAAARVPLAR